MKWDLVTNGRERWHMVQHPRQKKPLKKTDELISNKPNAIIYAMDEAGIKKEATITSCWCIKGKTSVVLSPATHDKINLVGAVRVGSGEVIRHEVERFDRYGMIGFLELILEKESNGRGPIYIILDNAKPHKAKDVQEFLKTKGQRFIM